MSTNRVIAKSAGTIGLLTGVSRVLGFIRDIVIAVAFGTGVNAEAFVVSFKIPNLLRDLVGEGAMNSAIVPVLTECREKKKEDFWRLVSTLVAFLGGILVLLSVLGILFTPVIVRLIAPGFVYSADPVKFPLTVRLTRVIFPYIFLIGFSALAMGVLNALKEFKSSAFGPILLNLSMIVSGFYFERTYGPMALVVAVLVGGVLQFACQVPALKRSGFRWERPDWAHSGAKKIGRLLIPRALGSALYQINIFVDSILASFESIVGPGGQSALYYANRLFQLPLAIFGLAMAQAVLPSFSEQLVQKDVPAFKRTFSMAVRSLMLVVLPASVGLVVWAEPIVRILFQHGHFDAYSTSITSGALFFYAFGILSCSLIKVLANSFYAMQDTKTPMRTMFVSVIANVALSLLLMRSLKLGGLTLASTISVTLNVVLLYSALRKRIGAIDEKRIASAFMRMLAASALMGVFCRLYAMAVLGPLSASAKTPQAAGLVAGILASIAVYVLFARLLGIEEMKKVLAWKRAPSRPR